MAHKLNLAVLTTGTMLALLAVAMPANAEPSSTDCDDAFVSQVFVGGCTYNDCDSQASSCDVDCLLYTHLGIPGWPNGECWVSG